METNAAGPHLHVKSKISTQRSRLGWWLLGLGEGTCGDGIDTNFEWVLEM
jgi:hypothetical protein